MKKVLMAAFAGVLCFLYAAPHSSAQADIEIGKTTIRLQSPVEVYSKDKDGNKKPKRKKSYTYTGFFFGFSFPVEVSSYEPTDMMPVKYGNSFEITFGVKQWFVPCRWYSFGLSFQYSHYDYRADGMLSQLIFNSFPSDLNIYREVFKTDNFGIGLYNRFNFGPDLFLDLGVYGDWAFSRQYKVRYFSGVGNSKEVMRERDGGKFLPLQGGVYAALGFDWFAVYCKYRFSNMFNHSTLPMEPPRLSIGVMLEF